MSFNKLNLIKPILEAVESEGYESPTPIQQEAIPYILEGNDLLGCAQTGTGKTAAFAIPVLQLLSGSAYQHKSGKIKALVLTPTRELAIQIGDSFAAYGKKLPLKHTVVFGGVSQGAQVNVLRKGVDILIATPGRLLDLINQKFISLKDISFFVLDEADRMLDMGFIHDVRKVIGRLPEKRQSIFFSATLNKDIQSLAGTILRNPQKIEVTPVSSTAETVEQQVYFVEKPGKKPLLLHLLADNDIDEVLVFSRTKRGADRITKDLNKAGVSAEAIHGDKSQNARQRALGNFKDKKIRVLVATDIAARGIDIEKLPFVINYDLPNEPETYVHRIGRTGRAGADGKAISFCDGEEKAYLKDINKLIGLTIPVVTEHPFSDVKPAPKNNSRSSNNRPKQATASSKLSNPSRRWSGKRRTARP
ncbi:DEAD/DEAH box helicase [Cytophagaceae bacterium ABcell3]|nr:DEAD/DEAH box helicase [Cytophagaceae bacterium ABcell3]